MSTRQSPPGDVIDDLGLRAAEDRIAEYRLEHGKRIADAGLHTARNARHGLHPGLPG